MKKTNITSDLLVAIKNGYSNKNKYAYCRYNKFCIDILWVLYKEGLISDFKVESNKVAIKLKYINNKPLLNELQLISKPKLQRYVQHSNLNMLFKKFDYFFISTSLGILSSKIILNNTKIGGQVLFGFKLNN